MVMMVMGWMGWMGWMGEGARALVVMLVEGAVVGVMVVMVGVWRSSDLHS